jgi:hypothetical protein
VTKVTNAAVPYVFSYQRESLKSLRKRPTCCFFVSKTCLRASMAVVVVVDVVAMVTRSVVGDKMFIPGNRSAIVNRKIM